MGTTAVRTHFRTHEGYRPFVGYGAHVDTGIFRGPPLCCGHHLEKRLMPTWLTTPFLTDVLSGLASAIPVIAAVYVFARGLFDERKGKTKRSLVEHLGRAAAAGGFPSALIL